MTGNSWTPTYLSGLIAWIYIVLSIKLLLFLLYLAAFFFLVTLQPLWWSICLSSLLSLLTSSVVFLGSFLLFTFMERNKLFQIFIFCAIIQLSEHKLHSVSICNFKSDRNFWISSSQYNKTMWVGTSLDIPSLLTWHYRTQIARLECVIKCGLYVGTYMIFITVLTVGMSVGPSELSDKTFFFKIWKFLL